MHDKCNTSLNNYPIERVARDLLGEPKTRTSKEIRYGNNRSLSVNLEKNTWYDYEAEKGGGIVDLISREGIANPTEYLRKQGFDSIKTAPSGRPEIVAIYDYVDENGGLLYQSVRYEPKAFRQRKPDQEGGYVWNIGGVKQVPYNLKKILDSDDFIWIVEGEKDANRLTNIGMIATCNAGGANKFPDDLTPHFKNRDVVICPDNDEAGWKHAELVKKKLTGIAKSIVSIDLRDCWQDMPDKADVSDFLDHGHTVDDLHRLVAQSAPPKPVPLICKPPVRDDYPIDSLGSILGPAARAISECVQCSPGVAGQSVLAAAALAVQGQANVLIDGRCYPISLFCLTVAESGDRKSAADKLALRSHNEFQKALYEDYKEELRQYQIERKSYDREQKNILENKKLSLSERTEKLGAIQEPLCPLVPYLKVEEPTYEGLQKSLESGRSSQGLFADEGGQFFGGHGMSSENMLKTISGLSKLWDGTPITRCRAATGESTILYDKRLSTHLMIQPIVAEKYIHDPVLQNQGFLARFLVCWPTSLAGSRLYNNRDATLEPGLIRFWDVIRSRLEYPLPVDNDETIRNLTLSAEAKEKWKNAYNQIEEKLAEGKAFAEIKPTASKMAENIARVAGVIALVENQDAPQVGADHLDSAIALITYYLIETLALNEREAVDVNLRKAQKILDWLKEKNKTSFSAADIYQRTRFAKSAKEAKRLISTLVEYLWIEPLDGPKERWRLRNV